MGCCFSTNKASPKNSAPPKQHHLKGYVKETSDKAAPPSLEEETVKEVLSETPTAIPAFGKIEKEKSPKLEFPKIEKDKIEKKASVFHTAEEISEVSEICSLSESVSTTTITERREDDERSRDDGEVRQRVHKFSGKSPRKRSFSGDLGGRTERGGKSPARKSEPSPGRRNNNAMKSVHGREVNQTVGQRISRTNGPRRDPGESSGRRSRSPVTCMEGGASRSALGRSPSSRKTGRSPGRIPAAAPENRRKLEEKKDGNLPRTNESLENPLVSLECFIFL